MGGNMAIVRTADGMKIYDNKDFVNENKELDKFDNIDINLDYADVELVSSDKYGIELAHNKNFGNIIYEVKNNTLSVKNEVKIGININFDFFGSAKKTKVKVLVPSNEILENITVNSKAGDINISNIKGNNLVSNCDFGNVKINEVNINKIESTAKSGDIEFNKVNTKGIIIENDFGDFEAENIVCEASDISVKSGEIKLNGAIKGENKISNDFGDIEINTTLADNEYSYKVDVDFGDVKIDGTDVKGNVSNTNKSAKNKIDITCASGDVKVSFK